MATSPIQRSALWDRVSLRDIPVCSTAQFLGLGLLPAIVIVLTLGLAAWYAVLSGGAVELMMALEADRLQAIETSAGADDDAR